MLQGCGGPGCAGWGGKASKDGEKLLIKRLWKQSKDDIQSLYQSENMFSQAIFMLIPKLLGASKNGGGGAGEWRGCHKKI